VVEGVSFNLLNVSDEPVTITVSQDVESTVTRMQDFVDAYNEMQSIIDTTTQFDSETYEKGPLFGESTVNTVRNRLSRGLLGNFQVPGVLDTLAAVGLRVGGNYRLEFDAERFRDTYENNPEAVEALFTEEDTGAGAVLTDIIESLTDEFDGLLTQRDQLIADQQELLNDRIESLNALLATKRARLEAQFVALESSLASLQDQQSVLSDLQGLVPS
jgi:flagellar hook-associated protein 2